jgi:hypothetical protein
MQHHQHPDTKLKPLACSFSGTACLAPAVLVLINCVYLQLAGLCGTTTYVVIILLPCPMLGRCLLQRVVRCTTINIAASRAGGPAAGHSSVSGQKAAPRVGLQLIGRLLQGLPPAPLRFQHRAVGPFTSIQTAATMQTVSLTPAAMRARMAPRM